MIDRCNDETKEPITHKAVIFKGADGKVRISPGYVVMKKKGKIKFISVKANVAIFIPELDFVEVSCESRNGARVFDLGAGTTITLVHKGTGYSKQSEPGEYSYAIYCKESKEFVKVNSPPAMIIEPED